VYYYYSKWRDDGTIAEVHGLLGGKVRQQLGKQVSPSLAIIDLQSSRTSRSGATNRGSDGGKKVKGRKRHIVVDSLGLLLVVVVHAANHHDSKAAFGVIEALRYRFPRLVRIIADAGYRGELAEKVKGCFGWILMVVMRKDAKKFEVLPQRWIVERTFSWFESYRRLSKDFEYHTYTQEAMIQLAMIKIMLNRIKK
jgi:putative transposase